LSSIRSILPELPAVTRARLQAQYGLNERDVDVLLSLESGRDIPYDEELEDDHSRAIAYFERICAGEGKEAGSAERSPRDPKVVINW
jgi:aspartyl-tRNA(Asn)/glutamyl-tRNA(Gln) amidotransferase subunit B